MSNKIQKIFILIFISSTILYASNVKNSIVKVNITTVKTQEAKQTIYLTGITKPTLTARVASPTEGPVQSCGSTSYIREGDNVMSGQTLLCIGKSGPAKAGLIWAKQAFKEQKTELQSIRILVEKGAVAANELDKTLSKYESTRANLVKAEEKVNDYTLKAPWNGVISTVHVRQGDYVIPRTPLVEIYNPSSIVVSFNVPEQYCMQINKNLNISILLDAYPNRVFEAKITRIYPQLDKKTHMRIVEAQIVANVKLIPQMFSRVNIVLKAFKDAVVLSSTSILKDKSNKPYVFKIKEDKAYKQYVKLGFGLDDGRVLILDGINKGEQIVTAGFQGLKDKTAVLVVLEKSKNNELK